MKISFQGEYGAYSEAAVYKHFGEEVTVFPLSTLDEVFEAVEERQADAGLVPIENSIGGSVNRTYDLLKDTSLRIAAEVFLPIHHCLLAREEQSPMELSRVYSHPQALKQCQDYLNRLEVEQRATYDTAGSAKMIREEGQPGEAAIASRVAAEEYGLVVLEEGIESTPDNVTRFLIIVPRVGEIEEGEAYKSSITFEAADRPGSLYRCLGAFAENGVNLTMIHSRPIKEKKWNYRFYLDFEGNLEEEAVRAALSELKGEAKEVKLLGSYPRGAG